jgi:hypothetical protein
MMTTKGIDHERAQRDLSASAALGCRDHDTGLRTAQTVPDPHDAVVKIDAVPRKAKYLSLAHAGRCGERKECAEAMLAGCLDEVVRFVRRQRRDLRAVHPWRIDRRCHIPCHESEAHRLTERAAECRVDLAHGRGGQGPWRGK